MKNLKLESFGVQEMDAKGLIKENGGRFSVGDYLIGHLLDGWVEIWYHAGQEGGRYQQSLPSGLKK
ncbi:hypothetical protein IM793_07430 [Pedobacter sp. MR2016-19]|uniref:hypothetical protein n=1 Tax=unclassified Pedobacter TaxID=2628915 RepID=UPI001875F7F3|nr:MULTISPECIES: hypothetical protein [unclassified Pedobacter]MBE5318981.1 hypothetical protein [Pedobacter sp. MR2016-19]QXU40500.1 hypothetical protein KYH19_16005 [Pedobacter sp. D749]